MSRVARAGRAIAVDAGIAAFGFADTLWVALACLALAGGADAVSGVFRATIWNETIPDRLRGRLAGVEMISWLSGPMLGNARAGPHRVDRRAARLGGRRRTRLRGRHGRADGPSATLPGLRLAPRRAESHPDLIEAL